MNSLGVAVVLLCYVTLCGVMFYFIRKIRRQTDV